MPDPMAHSATPFNAEPSLDRLRCIMITALPDFSGHGHGNIPDLNEAAHRLRVEGRLALPLDL